MPENVVYMRWETRKRIAKWAMRMMCGVTVFLLLYACFWPGGIAVVERLATLIVTLFTAFAGIVGTYMGLDVVQPKTKTSA